jgi:para-aminobenzoate synthetase / 4-amino-4-deoxychorismate lyase
VPSATRPDAGAGLFETVLVLGGRPVALGLHLHRLASSARDVYGATLDISPDGPFEQTARAVVKDLTGPHRLRILAAQAGRGRVSVEFETEPASAAFDGRLAAPVTLVQTVIGGGLGPHKWRDRTILAQRRAELGLGPSSHLLIMDTDGTVLETERANVVSVVDGALVSPPPDGRLLAGVTVSLAFGIAAHLGVPAAFRPLSLADLEAATEVFCTSAVSGLTPAGIAANAGGSDAGIAANAGGIAARLGPALFESWRRC